jgi:hypothetical protein
MSQSPVVRTHGKTAGTRQRASGLMRAFLIFGALVWAFGLPSAFAQQLDLEPSAQPVKTTQKHSATQRVDRYVPPGFLRQMPEEGTSTSSPDNGTNASVGNAPAPGGISYGGAAPLKATVTRTLYLPPAMYGQWNVSGTLLETNAPNLFSPTVNDIWLLAREGDQVTVTNPVNGAYATINVDKAEGDRATFHRTGTAGKHAIFQETPTITVNGDRFSGQSFNRVQNIRNGQVTEELYGIYHLEATRISAARIRFHPEAEQQDLDFQIEEVH